MNLKYAVYSLRVYAIYADNYEFSTGFYVLINVLTGKSEHVQKSTVTLMQIGTFYHNVYRLWRVATKILPDCSSLLYSEVYSALK